ncbi:MAG: hypothetical protein ACFNVM_06095, partial [Neisseria elongata]
IAKFYFVSDVSLLFYSGLNLNQDKATKPQTVQIVRQGEATPYWFKFNPLYILLDAQTACNLSMIVSKDVSMAERSQQQLNPNRGLRYNTRRFPLLIYSGITKHDKRNRLGCGTENRSANHEQKEANRYDCRLYLRQI